MATRTVPTIVMMRRAGWRFDSARHANDAPLATEMSADASPCATAFIPWNTVITPPAAAAALLKLLAELAAEAPTRSRSEAAFCAPSISTFPFHSALISLHCPRDPAQVNRLHRVAHRSGVDAVDVRRPEVRAAVFRCLHRVLVLVLALVSVPACRPYPFGAARRYAGCRSLLGSSSCGRGWHPVPRFVTFSDSAISAARYSRIARWNLSLPPETWFPSSRAFRSCIRS